MKVSTLHYITNQQPILSDTSVVSRHLRIDKNSESSLFCEGGLRTLGMYKSSLPPNLPLVSIVTVCLNSSTTIKQCIDSVFTQTYQNIEYIIIDGGSTDQTLNIIQKNASMIDYFVSEKDNGLYSAMNTGLSLCSGEFILLLNSDDWYEDNCVELLINLFLKNNIDYASGLANYVNENGEHVFTTQVIPFDESTLMRNPLRHETMLIPSWVYNKFGPYDESYKVISDFHFIIKLYEAGLKQALVKQPILNFRNTGVSSTDKLSLVRERIKLMHEQFPYVNSDDIHLISDLQNLTKDNALKILHRNRFYKKFYVSLLSLVKKKWKLDSHKTFITERMPNNTDHFRVETFCTSTIGGAGIGSIRRIKALRSMGIDVSINSLFTADDNINKINSSSVKFKNTSWTDMLDSNSFLTRKNISSFNSDEMFSSHHNVVRMTDLLPIINRADILHFHWMPGILEYQYFDLLKNKPIVWTLADMAPFTGGCHYSQNCEGYTCDCSNCPLIGENKALPNNTFKIKRDAYSKLSNLHIVCPSESLAKKAKQSLLFKRFPVHVIPNPVPFSDFWPVNKLVARMKLKLDPTAKYILFGAENLTSARKGGKLLIDALEIFALKNKGKNIRVITFGASVINLPLPQDNLGVITNNKQLCLAYSSANVFAFPSKEDNSPLTVSESLACGTPVVSFSVGNIPELISHGINGYIANYLDIESFSQGLTLILSAEHNQTIKMTLAAAKSVRSYNDPIISAKQHIELYRKIIKPR